MELLKQPLYLVEYQMDSDSVPVWFWETDKAVKMSPTFDTLDAAMVWMVNYEERE